MYACTTLHSPLFSSIFFLLPLPSLPTPSLSLNSLSPLLHSPNQGMLLSYNISNLVRTTLNLYSQQGKNLGKSNVLAVCKLIELLKCIQYTFHRQSMTVATYITHIINHYELNLLMGLDASTVRCCYFCLSYLCHTQYMSVKLGLRHSLFIQCCYWST